jgi:DMSO/TMAO reductase YedYZ molybdopterin-dependent catalytic subunit
VNTFRLSVRGHVDNELSMTLKDIVDGLPRVELAAVNQCSGNSRGYTEPPVRGRAMVERRHGQRQMDGRAAEGRA